MLVHQTTTQPILCRSTWYCYENIDWAADKAFDSINWGYLDSIMAQMGFGLKWRKWIGGCLKSSRSSVLINGSATIEFPITKGVRQGDPLSPFLFIIAMEGLNVALKSACHNSIFKGISIPNGGPSISHLFYADDAIFLGTWVSSNFINLARILRCFHATSGLKVNFNKSQVYGVGVTDREIDNCARILGCNSGSFPFKYLGVPVGDNMSLKRNWQPVIDRIQNKLSAWKAKTLSFGGRLTLTKSVLGCLPLYFFSLFKAPSSIIEEIERMRRKFLWGGDESTNKINWVSWKVVLGSKEKDGLGIGSMGSLNWALLVKWIWRFKLEKNALWRKVVCGIHNLHRKSILYFGKKSIPGVWQAITKSIEAIESIGIPVSSIFDFEVGNGSDTLFWYDRWANGRSLGSQFPRLAALDARKFCFVKERLGHAGNWRWKRKPRSPEEINELAALNNLIGNVQLSNSPDSLKSRLDNDGVYHVGDLRILIDSFVTTPMHNIMVWMNLVPIKICCFVWRVCIGRIPSAEALVRRGITVRDPSCHNCNMGLETTDHMLAGCDFAKEVLKRIWDWCGIDSLNLNFDSINEIISFAAKWGNCPKKRKVLLAIVYGYIWCLWKVRNDKIFNNKCVPPAKVADDIFSLVYSWVKHRGKFLNCNWVLWCCSPLNIV